MGPRVSRLRQASGGKDESQEDNSGTEASASCESRFRQKLPLPFSLIHGQNVSHQLQALPVSVTLATVMPGTPCQTAIGVHAAKRRGTRRQRTPMENPTSGRKNLVGGAVGTFVEWYDFLVYGLSAPILSELFFPAQNAAAALLGTFAIYAVSFLIRPLGGIVFGALGDKHGRIRVLSTTIILMGGSTLLIGLLPTFQSVGIFAAIALLACRLVQGMSAGGESTGGLSFIIESAPSGKRSYWISLSVMCSWIPAVFAAVLIFALRATLGDDAYSTWAWRIPFLLGGVFGIVGLVIRRRLDDPKEYTEAVADGVLESPLLTAVRTAWRSIIISVLLVAVQAVGAYLMLSYMYSHLVTVVGLEPSLALFANTAGIVMMIVVLVLGGKLADAIGRKPVMAIGAGCMLALTWPGFILASNGSLLAAIAGNCMIGVGVALFASGGFTIMLELFSTSMRYSGHSIGYNVGYAVFGGTVPLIATSLVIATQSPASPSWYVMAISVVGLVTLLFTPETKNAVLRNPVPNTGSPITAQSSSEPARPVPPRGRS